MDKLKQKSTGECIDSTPSPCSPVLFRWKPVTPTSPTLHRGDKIVVLNKAGSMAMCERHGEREWVRGALGWDYGKPVFWCYPPKVNMSLLSVENAKFNGAPEGGSESNLEARTASPSDPC